MGFLFMDIQEKIQENEFWALPELIIKRRFKKKQFSVKEMEIILNSGDTYTDFYQAVGQVMRHG